ncbi:MAG TPA: helix-turn-helix domain-containing protein [Candidatus Limnocylindria bacterium]|nr:helix-turn-helix domain-containing protein [Candidatus Limnocylindria bacterium]
MSSVVDVWRAVAPDATLVSGSNERLEHPVRGVARTRVAPPHLPAASDGALLVADAAALVSGDPQQAAALVEDLRPAAVLLTGAPTATTAELNAGPIPVLASTRTVTELADAATAYLADERAWLTRVAVELRLACAESTLAEPEVGTPGGLVAARLNRGVAVSVDGELLTLHPRRAGRALAARFAALHARLLAARDGDPAHAGRHAREGLWLIERRVRPGATDWLFDDLPFAAVDEVAADAVTATLRALLRRSAPPERRPRAPAPPMVPKAPPAEPPASADPVMATLLAVARANGRVSSAARALGVHRNTVLYRLRRATAERGLDPRRPADALRILAEAQRSAEASDGTHPARPPQ